MKIKTKISAVSLVLLVWVIVAAVAHGGDFSRTTLRVSQMRCSSCLRVFDAELRKIPGIVGMAAKFTEGEISVDHGTVVLPEQIADIITRFGYPALVVATKAIKDQEVNRFQISGFGGDSSFCNPGGESPVKESWQELRRWFSGRVKGRQQ